MTSAELYSKGARLWLPDKEHVWKAAEVVEDFVTGNLKVECDDGENGKKQVTLIIKTKDDLPPLRNPEILIGENDLTSLSYLNEPEVLYNLRVRFCNHNAIYTYCGIVLVAINPYEELSIYGEDTIRAYRGQSMGDLDPHIFAVAEESFTKMEREEQNQSIIVSGESGAGKTVSAKYAMRYFATVGGSATETQVERKVLASNPIMEAIGNAKTTRNDNSSRFGKYIEIDFNKQFTIIGANMRTYLLEKSRVVFQAPEERNYHIFYQLCASSHLEEFKTLRLSNHRNFRYTNFGESGAIPGVDDAEYFQETRNALTTLGFSGNDQKMMFRILAAVLHLGNVAIISGLDSGQGEEEEEGCGISMKDAHLPIVAELLGIDEEQMRTWLCFRKIVSQREVFTKPMTHAEAVFARDALAKHVYAQLFAWTVSHINKSLASSSKPYKFIGVLDIYGFETFEINSFEQFCINYANEKLQQQFNQHVFKLEQEEYVREKIEWKFIDFYDNQPCIDLIETKLGILDLLDEECRMPKGSDATWVQKLYEKCTKWKHFGKPRLSNTAFLVTHFADIVQYESNGFLVKNRDTVMEEHINILKASQFELVGELFREETAEIKSKTSVKVPVKSQHSTGTSQKQHKRTVGCQFVDSLSLLMNTLNSTTPHYVRCIKPNDDKMSFEFEPHRAVQQLRACGVLETIRISAAGFPSRWTYQDFFMRYRVLIPSKFINRGDLRTTSEKILGNLIKDADKFKFGKTKIFFRAGQVAYLEKLRSDKMKACCIIIQKRVRGWMQRKRYLKIRDCVLNLQRYSRGLLARRKALFMRKTKAAICIQRHVRGYIQRTKYKTICHAVLSLQCFARGFFARQRFQVLRRNHAAIVIQKHVRGWLSRVQYKITIKAVILLQSCVRRLIAKRELKQLKIEARSVEHVKKLNLGLENKIIAKQQKIEEMTKEMNSLRSKSNEFNEMRTKMEELKSFEVQARNYANTILQLEEKLRDVIAELDREKAEKMDILNEKDLKEKENAEIIERLMNEMALIKEDMTVTNNAIKARDQALEETINLKVESERKLLHQEFDEERRAYQKLLKENARLEQRYENLEGEILRLRGHRRTPSNVSIQSNSTEVVHDDVSEVNSLALDNTEEDVGYGSVRSQKSSRLRAENAEWDQMTQSEDGSVGTREIPVPKYEDISLVLKLQQKLNEVMAENDRLRKKVEVHENREDRSPKDDGERTKDLMRLQELEMEIAKVKDNNRKLLSTEVNGIAALQKESLIQYDALQEELVRRREECVQLRSILANRSQEMKQIAYESYGGEVEKINEDGELLVAYESQKRVLKQLENEVQELTVRESECRMEIKKLQGDNERQQKLISQNLKKTPQAQVEAVMQHEITRLTSENLDLRERNDVLSEQIRKLKKQLKIYAKKLKESTVPESAVEKMETSQMSLENQQNMPVVKHKTADYLGMFEYRREDESALIKGLIYDLKPRISTTLLPGLPAYILFMCIRHTDYINDDEKVRSLLNTTVNSIKRIIKKRRDDLDITIMWLATVCRLLHNLKQYSGDVAFQSENTPKQNEQCLRNFDLSEYRQVLSDIAVWIYQAVIKIMEEKVQPLIIAAVLEHEAIPGIAANKPLGLRGRSSSLARELESPVDPQMAVQNLLKELTGFHLTLSMHGVDPELIRQVFKQLMYFICAGALNNLLLRKDLCHWSKGMQIRYNLSHLEQWFRDQKLHDGGVMENLAPIIQASQLLQARKTDEDVQTICDMCDKLTVAQIIKILNLYTPSDEFEERVPMAFIRKIQERLSQRAEGQQQLLMDTKFAYPVRFPFNPSNIRLEDITVPDILNLPMLKKI